MYSKKIVISLFMSFIFLFTSQGQNQNAQNSKTNLLIQDSINFLLLIPYNDNNKWAWSDTLGNIVIEPELKRTSFFGYDIINERKIYYASVETEVGKNYYISNIGLAAPSEYELLSWELGVTFIKDKAIRIYHVVKDKNKKIGILESVSQEMIVSPQYDSLSRVALLEDIILLKEKDKPTFDYFSISKNVIQKSDIVHIDNLSIKDKSKGSNYCCSTVVKMKNGSTEEIYKGNFTPFPFIDSLEYKSDLNTSVAYDMEPKFIPIRKNKIKPVEQPDVVLATHNYSQYGQLAKKYGFTSLSIVRKNNKVGIVNELDKIIVPFDYDKIQFTTNHMEVQLFKDGKQGRKLLFTKYPLIEAKYDSLKHYNSLSVKPGWSFGIYEIKIGDFIGYIGENGVEYFKLD